MEKRRKGVGVCLEVKNGQRLLEELLLPGPMIAAPLALLNRTVADKSLQCPTPHLEIGHQENYTSFAEPADSWLV